MGGQAGRPWARGEIGRRALLALAGWLVLGTVVAEEMVVGLAELFNYQEYSPRLVSSGQPTREQFPAVRAAGVEAVINLAPVTDPASLPDEQAIVEGLGMAYTHIPVDWEAPAAADLERFFAAMDAYADRRLLVHCYANSRASAFVFLWRVLKAGEDAGAARADMVRLWDYNAGYEYRNVPQWQAFVEGALAAKR